MKKLSKIFFSVICFIFIGFIFSACGKTPGSDSGDDGNSGGGDDSAGLLSFNTRGGEEIAPMDASGGITLPTPERKGYAFRGWYTSSNLKGNPVTTITSSKSKTVYAKWESMYFIYYSSFDDKYYFNGLKDEFYCDPAITCMWLPSVIHDDYGANYTNIIYNPYSIWGGDYVTEAHFIECPELANVMIKENAFDSSIVKASVPATYCYTYDETGYTNTVDTYFADGFGTKSPAIKELTILTSAKYSQIRLGNLPALEKLAFGPNCVIEDDLPQWYYNDCYLKEIAYYNTIPEGESKSLTGNMFFECPNLTKITIANGIEEINPYAIAHCPNVEEIIFPSTLKTIHTYALSDLSKMQNIVLPNGVETIYDYAFECQNLKSINIPSSVQIFTNAIVSGVVLESISISPNSNLTAIDFVVDDDILDLTMLTNLQSVNLGMAPNAHTVTLPESVISISFGGAKKLENLNFSATSQFIIEDGFVYSLDKTELLYIFNKTVLPTNFVVPECVTILGDGALIAEDITYTTFTSHSNVKEIRCDIGKPALTSVSLNAGLEVFGGCSNSAITELTIPSSVKSILGKISNCTQLKTLTFEEGSQVTSMTKGLLHGCSSLQSLTLPFLGDRLDNPTQTALCYTFLAEDDSDNPETYFNIFDFTHRVPNSLKTVRVLGGTRLMKLAFAGISGLKNIYLPSEMTLYGADFSYYKTSPISSSTVNNFGNLSYEHITAGIMFAAYTKSFVYTGTVRDFSSFDYTTCTKLEKLSFPRGVTVLREGMFMGLTNLKEFTWNGTEDFALVTIPNNLFKGCTNLECFEIPTTVSEIGECAFEHCEKLDTTIPASCNDGTGNTKIKISNRAFAYTGITRVILSQDWIFDNILGEGIQNPFVGMFNLVEFEGTNSQFTVIDGILCEVSGSSVTVFCYPAAKPDICYDFSQGFVDIKNEALAGVKYLTSVNFGVLFLTDKQGLMYKSGSQLTTITMSLKTSAFVASFFVDPEETNEDKLDLLYGKNNITTLIFTNDGCTMLTTNRILCNISDLPKLEYVKIPSYVSVYRSFRVKTIVVDSQDYYDGLVLDTSCFTYYWNKTIYVHKDIVDNLETFDDLLQSDVNYEKTTEGDYYVYTYIAPAE